MYPTIDPTLEAIRAIGPVVQRIKADAQALASEGVAAISLNTVQVCGNLPISISVAPIARRY